MQFPGNGRIAVIDDLWKEAKPLLSILSKNGAPFLYYDGDVRELPKKPIAGLRFLFLDLDFQQL